MHLFTDLLGGACNYLEPICHNIFAAIHFQIQIFQNKGPYIITTLIDVKMTFEL